MISESKAVVYSTKTCPYCRAAMELLGSKSIVFEEVDVTGSPEMRQHLVEKSGGRTTVPQIFFGERHIGGYDDLVEHFRKKESGAS